MTERDAGQARAGQGLEFEFFLSQLVGKMYGEQLVTRVSEGGIDLEVRNPENPVLLEATLQGPETAQRWREIIGRLERAADGILRRNPTVVPHLVVAFPGAAALRRAEPLPPNVEVWDGPRLRMEAERFGVFAPNFLTSDANSSGNASTVLADQLIRRLHSIEPGRADWMKYEKYCEDTLNYLFSPPLSPAVTQSRNENGRVRRDFVMPNYATNDFWNFMRIHYRGDFIVAEVKNYSEPVGKMEVMQLATYLTRHGTGLVGLLCSRHGMADDAKLLSRENWILHDKLILDVRDEDLERMLELRRADQDPAELLRQRLEDFRLGI